MTTASRRTAPLAAQPEPVDEIQVHHRPEAGDLDDVVAVAPTLDPATRAERDARFAEGVRTLRVGGASLRLDERILMILGGVVAPLGLVVVLLGWWGAAHTPYVFEQLPYLISGGLLGVGLIFLGAFFYFAHWMTQLVKEHRVQSQAVLEALQRLQDQVAEQARPRLAAGTPSTNGTHRHEVTMVATERGNMAHRPECIVVAGKTSLRPVTPAEGVSACKLCEPF